MSDSEEDEKEEFPLPTFGSVELCFCIDCTGSMFRYIKAIKEKIHKLVDRIHTAAGIEVKLGVVGYRDFDCSPNIEHFHFNTNVLVFKQFMENLEATGGRDLPEDVLGGLYECTQMPWTEYIETEDEHGNIKEDKVQRIIFHIGDAPPHGRQYHDEEKDEFPLGHRNDRPLTEIFSTFKEKRIQYHFKAVGSSSLRKMVDVFARQAETVGYEIIEREAIEDCHQMVNDAGDAVLSSLGIIPSRLPVQNVDENQRHPRRQLRPTNDKECICAIDFGTFGTACAISSFAKDDEPLILQWQHQDADKKTRTNLLLDRSQQRVQGLEGFGDAAADKYQNLRDEERSEYHFFSRFKMKLYEAEIREEKRQTNVTVREYIPDANKDEVPSDVVLEQALSFIFEYAMDAIKEQYNVRDPTKVEWVLTVPAIWSPRSRQKMERAAYAAGIPRRCLSIALEPECAAIVVQDSKDRVNPGECYMLLDCGGGTIDITMYIVEEEHHVREIHYPTGGPYGSTYIDEAFLDYLKHVLPVSVWDQIKSDSALKHMIRSNFNNSKIHLQSLDRANVNLQEVMTIIKDYFRGGDENKSRAEIAREANEYFEQVEYKNDRGGFVRGGIKIKSRGNQLVIEGEVWEMLFNTAIGPLTDRVEYLLTEDDDFEENLDGSHIHAIFVVGGFAESSILMSKLQEKFETPTRKVVRPPTPMLTVVKGAVGFASTPTRVIEHRAPKTLGIGVRAPFQEGDPIESKVTVGGRDYTNGVFFPLIRKNQPIPEGMKIVQHVEGLDFEHFVVKLYQSNEREPEKQPDRTVPQFPCATIGPVPFPRGFDFNKDDIVLEIDVGEILRVKVRAGSYTTDQPIEWH